jgi:hypothetical protein
MELLASSYIRQAMKAGMQHRLLIVKGWIKIERSPKQSCDAAKISLNWLGYCCLLDKETRIDKRSYDGGGGSLLSLIIFRRFTL